MKIAYIIIMLVLLIGYNAFFNKKEGSAYGGYSMDFGPVLRGLFSVILYLLSWIAWFIIW